MRNIFCHFGLTASKNIPVFTFANMFPFMNL